MIADAGALTKEARRKSNHNFAKSRASEQALTHEGSECGAETIVGRRKSGFDFFLPKQTGVPAPTHDTSAQTPSVRAKEGRTPLRRPPFFVSMMISWKVCLPSISEDISVRTTLRCARQTLRARCGPLRKNAKGRGCRCPARPRPRGRV